MKFLDKLLDRWRHRQDAKKDAVNADPVKRNPLLRSKTSDELDDESRRLKITLSGRFPMGCWMYRCSRGFFIKKYGYAPFSGPAPSPAAAERAALRNLGAL